MLQQSCSRSSTLFSGCLWHLIHHFKLQFVVSLWLTEAVAYMQHHGRASSHRPELILNNFGTRLGHRLGRMFASIFSQDPNFKGRRAVTFHNQRDYIFFRLIPDAQIGIAMYTQTGHLERSLPVDSRLVTPRDILKALSTELDIA